MKQKTNVLDRGYVILADCMGSDLEVVNAARASFAKRSEWLEKSLHTQIDEVIANHWDEDQFALMDWEGMKAELEQLQDKHIHRKTESVKDVYSETVDVLNDDDFKLIRYLARNEHTSPFRHCFLRFEIKAPLMVARQWWKHVVGSDHTFDAWNESSRRYVTAEPEFYAPSAEQWRGAVKNVKQGSGDVIDIGYGKILTENLKEEIDRGMSRYKEALAFGVAVEQARLFLPAYALYVTWQWSTSLQATLHFLHLRTDKHAQWEIRQYADAVAVAVRNYFPVSFCFWNGIND